MSNSLRRGTVTTPLYSALSITFVGLLIIANILANHMLQFGPWLTDAGILVFPLTYILSDIFSEVYGYQASRKVTWYAVIMNFTMGALIKLAVALPQPEWYDGSIFNLAVGSSWRIVLASLISFNCGDWVNDIIFRELKRKANHPFMRRAFLSSLGGQAVDSVLFISIAFLGIVPGSEIISMMVLGLVGKMVYEVLALPLTNWAVNKVKDREVKYANYHNWD